MIAIADTGFVVSVAMSKDRFHRVCVPVYLSEPQIYLPQTALTEVLYFIKRDLGNHKAAEFLFEIPTSRYELIALEPADVHRAGELMTQYADSRLDFVDASVIAIAERLNITRILTIDKRDFGMVRPTHADAFDLLP